MSSCYPICRGCGGRNSDRFLIVGVYILVVVGFLKHADILQQYNNNNNDGAATAWVPSSASARPHAGDHIIKNGLAPSVCEAFSTPVHIFWKQFESEIKEAATLYAKEQSNNTMFRDWIDELFRDHYQSYQLRRSAIHPPGLEVTLKVLEIISKRVNYLQDSTLSAAPPLHILVSGGSVTSGIQCGINHVGIVPVGERGEDYDCAWPARLEHLFNRVLFDGKKVVKVSNLAVGGSNSEIGKALLEYHLFPDSFQQPDIVIWGHAVNDSYEKDKARAYFESIPGFVNAAHKLRICDDHLPLVVMNEEFFGQNNDISGAIYKASNWFGLMGISQRNVISHKTFANFDNDDYVKSIIDAKGIHPGMGGHIGTSWTVFFNFISAFTDVCDYRRVSSSPMSIASTDVAAKSIGPYKENDYGDISSEWKEHRDNIREMCLLSGAQEQEASTSLQSPCTYAFMVNRMTSIGTKADVDKKMNEVLTSSTGWKAEGFPIKQPRAGFYAKEPNAHFSLKIDTSMETKYITIMSMKSYGDNFKDTNLEVDVRIERKGDVAAAVTAEAEVAKSSKYEVTGYHETRTSIHVPHKFELPDGGAEIGDSIVVNFRLVSGSYFKIAGLAFCRY